MATLTLTNTDGQTHNWTVEKGSFEIGVSGHALAFTLATNQGTKHFALHKSGYGNTVKNLFDDHAKNAIKAVATTAGGYAGRSKGTLGSIAGGVIGFLASKIVLDLYEEAHETYYYYGDDGQIAFKGPVKVKLDY